MAESRQKKTTAKGDSSSKEESSAWEGEFRVKEHLYEDLAAEAEFALGRALRQANVQVHTIKPRTKSLDSLREKVARKEYEDPMREAEDLAGVRVVVLFRSDLPRVREVIHDLYEPLSEEDTIDGGEPSSFGYMSVHYIVRLKEHHAGPRYDHLQGLKLEIQVRTIVTDAWDSISRYLDYAGESSIPSALRRDFFALSGLFYVADKHFELFYIRSEESRHAAEAAVSKKSDAPIELNLDTLTAYLREKYPDRDHAKRQDVSELVEEIVPFGFHTIDGLDKYLKENEAVVALGEAETVRTLVDQGTIEEDAAASWKFADIGAVRTTLRQTMPEFEEMIQRKRKSKSS
jgi:putative GTP pyrophosphokinase